MYEFFSSLTPKKFREAYRNLISYTGLSVRPERLAGFLFLFGFGVAFAVAFESMIILNLDLQITLLVFVASYFVFHVFAYMWLWLSAESKARFVDSILPDALNLMAMNIRAGLTTDRALLLSARPEFGPLEQEIKAAGKKILSGEDISHALLGIPKKIKSKFLDNAIKLIVQGIGAGGELASLLEQTAEDIHNTKFMESEVKANVLMYVVFVLFAVCIGAPVVFGISTYLVEVLASQMSKITFPETLLTSGSGLVFRGFAKISISPEFIVFFSILSLMVTSLFGGLIIGLIKEGKEKEGVKYIPILMAISVSMFLATRFVAKMFFTV